MYVSIIHDWTHWNRSEFHFPSATSEAEEDRGQDYQMPARLDDNPGSLVAVLVTMAINSRDHHYNIIMEE